MEVDRSTLEQIQRHLGYFHMDNSVSLAHVDKGFLRCAEEALDQILNPTEAIPDTIFEVTAQNGRIVILSNRITSDGSTMKAEVASFERDKKVPAVKMIRALHPNLSLLEAKNIYQRTYDRL